MNQLFISYSHQDKAFVDRLYAALIAKGFDSWMDSARLIGSADWWDEIRANIEARNSVIYVVTNASLASEVCTMEVHHALRFHKRLIPIILIKPNERDAFDKLRVADLPMHIMTDLQGQSLEEIALKNWRYLTRYHWIFFDQDEQFDQRLDDLVTALNYESEHVQKHTLYGNRAINWHDRGRHPGFLLSGVETREMRRWFEEGRTKDPPPHELHEPFLKASERHQRLQRIRAVAITAGAIAVTILAAFLVVTLLRDRIFNPPPRQLRGSFNIAIAPLVEDINGSLEITNKSREATNIVDEAFANFIVRQDLTRTIDHSSERIPSIEGTTPEAREDSAAEIARLVNAQAVVYGQISTDNELQLRVYIDPLFSGGEELAGETRFGASIPLPVSNLENPIDRQVIQDAILPRNQALTQFLYGISLTRARLFDRALEQFIDAANVTEAWVQDESGSGLEVVYLWIGTAYNLDPYTRRVCFDPDSADGVNVEERLSLFCARDAYNLAIRENALFPRAHIGLGNVHINAGSPAPGNPVARCNEFPLAIAEYRRALDLNPSEEYAAMTLLKVKTYSTIGQANARPLYLGCAGDWYQAAVDAFEDALDAVPVDTDSPVAQWEKANVLYWLGRTHRGGGNLDPALTRLNEALAAINSEAWHQSWQNLRYKILLEIGYVFYTQAQNGEDDLWGAAFDQFAMIAAAHDDPNIRYDDDWVLSQALYQQGLITETREGCAAAKPYYAAVVEMDQSLADLETFKRASERCPSSDLAD